VGESELNPKKKGRKREMPQNTSIQRDRKREGKWGNCIRNVNIRKKQTRAPLAQEKRGRSCRVDGRRSVRFMGERDRGEPERQMTEGKKNSISITPTNQRRKRFPGGAT